LQQRNDTVQLWENFLVAERAKFLAYSGNPVNAYFWRTYTGAELDYIEESGGKLAGYEFKWKVKQAKPPRTWTESYHASFRCINRENYLSFIAGASPPPESLIQE
jgi:uncharacterized protein